MKVSQYIDLTAGKYGDAPALCNDSQAMLGETLSLSRAERSVLLANGRRGGSVACSSVMPVTLRVLLDAKTVILHSETASEAQTEIVFLQRDD